MIAIIPAKENSTRLVNKNIKLIKNKPLIVHSIIAAKNSKFIKKIIVSTDSKKISNIAKKYGVNVHFRPKSLTKNKVTSFDVCKHIIDLLKKEKKISFRSFVILQPTSPLRSSKDIDNAAKLYIKKKADMVFSVKETEPIEWHSSIDKDLKILDKKKTKKNTQYHKKNYVLNGAIYIYKKNIKISEIKNSDKKYAYIMPKFRSIDIDDEIDFKIAKLFMKLKIN